MTSHSNLYLALYRERNPFSAQNQTLNTLRAGLRYIRTSISA